MKWRSHSLLVKTNQLALFELSAIATTNCLLEFKLLWYMRIEKILKLAKKPNHINAFLTHWTGRNKSRTEAFDIVSKIVNSGELKFSSNKISFPSSELTINTQMICFTDTPIKQSSDHCRRYNYFGISFNKEAMMGYGANPVLYLVDNRQPHQDAINELRPQGNEHLGLVKWIDSMLQPYDSKEFSESNWAEFYEREWRINRILPFDWIATAEYLNGSYNEYAFEGRIRKVNGTEEFYLPFNKAIIENIITPLSYKARARKLIKDNNLDCELILIEE